MSWSSFSDATCELLDEDDDPSFWQAAIDRLLIDTNAAIARYFGNQAILLEIGRCSHWILPHWKNRAGTAWPFGYGNVGQGYSYSSLPEFDWSLRWMWNAEQEAWTRIARRSTRRPLVQRIAIPARTARHPQATVHTIWMPGSPQDPKHKLTSVYGFRRDRTDWICIDHWHRQHGGSLAQEVLSGCK